ncbi:hypothetical protein B0H15DRAFT_453347 [Mycena belliarum]|uniref:Uncharacterized protein n=1 Tax=Mycena belliarum TaxID=1033014 RepID=A0AAD6XIS2_9AGAR|nr:hypothetical protein B0H15DRAFT_453347 [Mycena belliae]
MQTHIPDEILHEILSPAIQVPDEAFSVSATSSDSPFNSIVESSSAFLLVSKAWLRVGTPLLYHDVILRSKAQAQALASALGSNPDLGRFIRKLRVEGGYAISMHKILKNSRNITDLALAPAFLRADNACGLRRGLPLIDPVRVVLHHRHSSDGRIGMNRELADVLGDCIRKWKNLTVFDIAHVLEYNMYINGIAKALKDAPKLRTLVISDPEGHLFNEPLVPKYISTVAKNTSLRHIKSRPLPPDNFAEGRFYQALLQDVRLKKLFELPPSQPPFIYPAALSADPMLEDRIWSRVLFHAFYHTDPSLRYSEYSLYDTYTGSSLRSRSLRLLLVSKTFARLGMALLYENPIVRKTNKLAQRLSQQPSLGQLVRHLSLKLPGGDLSLNFLSVVLRTTMLTTLDCDEFTVTWKAFTDMCNATGSSLHTLRLPVAKPAGSVRPSVFALLPRIRSLIWDSNAVFKTAHNLLSSTMFDTLVNLSINVCDPSFLALLSRMELPSLRRATFSARSTGGTDFFEKHGGKLSHLTVSTSQLDSGVVLFSHCPSIRYLGISCGEVGAPHELSISATHARVERMAFRYVNRATVEQAQAVKFKAFFSHLTRARFPALREVEHQDCDWPTTERNIHQCCWVPLAESLLKHDIQLVNKDGAGWKRPRARLQYTKKTSNKPRY